MREILFRGKRKDNGEWVYGGGFVDNGEAYIITCVEKNYENYWEIIPETLGQFTGLLDKNGKKIFEGDIIQECGMSENWIISRRDEFSTRKHVVIWYEDELQWVGNIIEDYLMEEYNTRDLKFLSQKYVLEIIGNIHEVKE